MDDDDLSPCIGLCQIDEDGRRCIGCGRLLSAPDEPPAPAAEPVAAELPGKLGYPEV